MTTDSNIAMTKRFVGKTAVVTGGTRGIGRAISIRLAREGAKVFALYGRSRAAADELLGQAAAEGLNIECLRGDLTHEGQFAALVAEIREKAPTIDFLVHSAASGVHRAAHELSLKHLRWTFEVNVFSIHNLITSLIENIPSGGRVIGITSSGGVRVIPFYTAVGASKGALEAMFRHYAHEFAARGISVNCVCPGLVLTDAVEHFPDKEGRIDRAQASTPIGELTVPDDVASTVAFLCTPEARKIVGQTLVIDGGKTLLS